jgi:hypothetical protein
MAEAREMGQDHYAITVFPVRHNPTTDQTEGNSELLVTVTYEAPVPYGILNFAPASEIFPPGVLPSFSADVFNMGAEDLSMHAELAIYDSDTDEILMTQNLVLSLTAGAVYPLFASGMIPLEPGSYGARLRVWDSAGSETDAAVATTRFEVKTVVLSDLTAVHDPLAGQVSMSVQATNLSEGAGTLALAFAFTENGDLPVGAVVSEPVFLEPGEVAVIDGKWDLEVPESTLFAVEAIATFDESSMNSVQTSFTANPVPTPTPTATPSPTASATPSPTGTATATPTETPTASPSPSPTPAGPALEDVMDAILGRRDGEASLDINEDGMVDSADCMHMLPGE